MKAPVLIGIVVGLHMVAVGSIVIMQGCGTRGATRVEPPPAPVMPPRQEIMAQPKPVFQPPVPVEHAPSMMESSAAKVYEIKPGDSLSKIASRLGVSKRELIELNKIKDENKIRIGQKLYVPDYASVPQQAPVETKPAVRKESAKPAPAKAAKEVIGAGSTYVVQGGDSLSRIAAKHNTTISALRETNKLKNDKILVGQKLVIPGDKKEKAAKKTEEKPAVEKVSESEAPASAALLEPAPPAPPAPAVEEAPVAPAAAAASEASAPALSSQSQPMEYPVQEGDTLEDISKIFLVGKDEIMKLNNLQPGEPLKPKQILKIPPSR